MKQNLLDDAQEEVIAEVTQEFTHESNKAVP